jgi:hypothetical protein
MLGLLGAALFWQLGSLVPGYSQTELQTYQAAASLGQIYDNPLNAPFLLVVKALSYVFTDSLITVRLAATLFGLGTLVLFAVILRQWHDTRTAIIGTLLFGVSAWFLHTARLGTPEVLMFGVFVLAACGFWLKETRSWLAVFVCLVAAAVLLYVPGMVWFIALGIVWQWKAIDRIFKLHLIALPLAVLTMLAAIAPLAWAIYRNHALIKPFLGVPENWPAPLEVARNLLEIPFHFFVRNEANPAVWLGTAPILDIFSLSMFVLGGYLYLRHVRLVRTHLFMAIMLLTVALMAIGSPITFSVIIPFVYMVIAGGVAYLFDRWFMVFPRNPIARSIGWGLISIIIALVCAYHIIHYFVGWPHAAATHEIYTIQSDTIKQ